MDHTAQPGFREYRQRVAETLVVRQHPPSVPDAALDRLSLYARAVLAAYLRRAISMGRWDQWGRQVVTESSDYHPAKAAKIYRRHERLLDSLLIRL